jgi:hypothetical protein
MLSTTLAFSESHSLPRAFGSASSTVKYAFKRETSAQSDADSEPPEQVIWKNVAWRGWERGVRSLLAWGILVTIIIFMLPIIAILQQLINLEGYSKKPGNEGYWARWVLRLPFIGRM